MIRTVCPVLAAMSFVIATAAWACQIPVFRYALERWPSDKYELLVLHQGPLQPADQARLDALREATNDTTSITNVTLQVVDLAETKDPDLIALWTEHSQTGEPVMAVLYPRQAQEIPNRLVQVVPMTDQSFQQIAESPVRKEIAKRLLDGESAVWIFVPSGDEAQDAAALKTLREHLRISEERLELPSPEELESEDFAIEALHIELRIAFSVVTLDRNDPREKFLLDSLLRSESDLETFDQPMAFPVLGRGRVLYALVGNGISGETIAMASNFVVGPCSCQVKNQNPGFDLMLAVDWEKSVGEVKLSKELPDASQAPVLLQIPPGRGSR